MTLQTLMNRSVDLTDAPYRYQPLSIRDFRRLYWLRQQPYLKRVWPTGSWARFTDEMFESNRSPTLGSFLVYQGRHLIALIAIGFGSTQPGRYWFGDQPGTASIDILILNPRFLGNGHGTKIISDVSERLLALPCVRRVSLDPHPSNIRAIRCYEKAGFKNIGLFRNTYGEPAQMMLKRQRP